MRLNESEWKVMNVVWDQHPASVRDVLEALEAETGWAYSTVKTLLARLAEKGAVAVQSRANVRLFSPRVSRDQARHSAVHALLDRAFDGAFGSLVHHLVGREKLGPRDRDALRAFLDEADAQKSRKKSR